MRPEPEFKGKIEFSAKDSIPDWPQPVRAPDGAPNIVLIMLDDVGFGDTATFGGPAHTPNLDKLAARGLRYNAFHTTAICNATRAALLSGRNHHRMGFGTVVESGFPGYTGIWKKSTVSIPEVLRRNGYRTAAFGKWHNTPAWELSAVGPFDRWPTGLGFEYFFGNMFANGSQWEPTLWRNTVRVAPPPLEQGIHLTTLITDEAIGWVRAHGSLAPDKPYFLYLAPEAAHTPHHVARQWIERYRGRFDQGWDRLREETFARQKALGVVPANTALTARPDELPAWSSLDEDEKRLFARQMEVFAAFVSHTDHEIGRLIQAVDLGPHADNTLILFIVGDNGDEAALSRDGTDDVPAEFALQHRSVAEQLRTIEELGGPLHFNSYASGWAWAGSTPFQWVKHVASHFGGMRNPLLVSWPARIKDPGGLRSQFTHVNDIAATLYDAAGITFPDVVDGVEQEPLDGPGFADTFADLDAPARHRVQYFEMEGNRGIYQDGWFAAARHGVPWLRLEQSELLASGRRASKEELESDRWELYRLDEDFSQAHDLAARHPDKLCALQALFDREARQNNVYPLDVGLGIAPGHPLSEAGGRRHFVYYPGFPGACGGFPGAYGSPNFDSSHRITAHLIIPSEGAEGVIIAAGSRFGGFVLYIKEQRLHYEGNSPGKGRDIVSASQIIPAGPVTIALEFVAESAPSAHRIRRTGAGTARLFIQDRLVGEANLLHHCAGWEGVDIGRNYPSPVGNGYEAPFKFSGVLEKVEIQVE
jgi:arylsulfatase